MMALCTAGQGPARSSSFRFGFEERHGICFSNTERDLSSKATSVTAAADTPQCTPQPPNPSACALLRRYDLRSRTSWRHRRYRAYAGISLSPGPGASDRLPVRPQSSTRARETSPQPRPVASCLLEVTRESNSESDLAGRRTCTGKGDSESDSPRDRTLQYDATRTRCQWPSRVSTESFACARRSQLGSLSFRRNRRGA